MFEGGAVIQRSVLSSKEQPIVIEDDDDHDDDHDDGRNEVQETPRPAWRRSTHTPGMFVTPQPWERNTSSSGRQTSDLTAEPEGSGGMSARRSSSTVTGSLAPVNRRPSGPVLIDLTLLSDEEEGSEPNNDCFFKDEEEEEDHLAFQAPTPSDQSLGAKRRVSLLSVASEPTDSHKRQRTDARHVSYT